MDGKTHKIKPIIYSAQWCAFCHAAMQYLDRLGVAFEKRDVEEDQKYAIEAVSKSGQMGIPVIDIDGTIIVGFDRPKIDASLHAKKLV
jgi:glutaredoxin-like YruB-family protein